MATAITKRADKGSALTITEMDTNLQNLADAVDSKQATLVSGTNIKTINGSSILGSGDVTVTGGASATKTISNQSAAYTVVASDLGKIINCTGTFTVSLTAAATLGSGFTCTIWNTDTGAITIDPNLAETIDGIDTLILRRGEGLDIVCDGTNWQTSYKKTMRGYAENCANTNARPIVTGINSVAIGSSNTASGTGAYAIGYATQATSLYGVAIGTNSGGTGSVTATGSGAMALGGSYASGIDSFAAAIANNTSTYGATIEAAIAIGTTVKASGSGAIAIGYQAISSNIRSVALGYAANASQVSSIAIGQSATSSGNGSIAIGGAGSALSATAIASGHCSVALSNGKAAQTGKFAFSATGFGVSGSAQFGKIVLSVDTSGTATVLTSDKYYSANVTPGIANQLVLASNQAMTFQGMLIGKQAASSNMASYIVKGAIVNNAGTMSMSALSIEKIIDTIVLTTEPTFTVNNTIKCLSVTSGAKDTINIRWVCNLDTVEVINA
jgi:hypothetical protein